MFMLLFGFGLLSGFPCNRHCLLLLSIFVIVTHLDNVDTAESKIRRHGPIQSTPILSNLSSSVPLSSSLSSSSASLASSLSTSISTKSHSNDSPTISVVTTKKHDTSTNDIRLEDFFLNSSGDEPLILSLKSNARLTTNGFTGRETFIKTATVIATVYVGEDSSSDEGSSECTASNCDANDEIPPYLLANKSYWILTRVYGYLSYDDIPMMQERLRELYRIAFARQQSIHLGLINTTSETTTDQMPTKSSIINETIPNATEFNQTITIQPTTVLKDGSLHDSISSSSEPLLFSSMEHLSIDSMDTATNSYSQSISHKQKRSMSSNQSTQTVLQSITSTESRGINADDTNDMNSRNGRKMRADKMNRNDGGIGRINVVIHNISVITDTDYSDEANQGNVTMNPLALGDNQTDIVYSVFVNGIPVWAIIAVDDLKFMRRDEVVDILGMPVAIIAEPYLKEPQATPLIPSSTNSQYDKPIIAMLIQNPFIFTCLTILLALIILLLMVLMLVAGSKTQRRPRKKSTTKSVQTAQHSFLPPVPEESSSHSRHSENSSSHTQSHIINETSKTRLDSICEMKTVETATIRSQTKQVGTQITSIEDPSGEIAYERDHSFIIIPSSMSQKSRRSHRRSGTPKICFPEPPSSPSSQSQSSSTPTSDSSIYYIKKQKGRRHHQVHGKRQSKQMIAFEPREYAMVAKKSDEKTQKKASKHRQKYLKSGSLNRVGAFDDVPPRNSSHSSIDVQLQSSGRHRSEDNDIFDRRSKHLYEHIEAFNPLAVLKPKMLSQYTSTQKIEDDSDKITKEHAKIGEEHGQIDKVHEIIDVDYKKIEKSPENLEIDFAQSKPTVNPTLSTINHKNNRINREMLYQIEESNEGISTESSNQPEPPDIPEHIHFDSSHETKSSDECEKSELNANQNDNLSVGSFLSMTSVKSFPKCQVPESLNYLLSDEKTVLTKYDEIEATQLATNASRIPRIVDTKAKVPPKPTYDTNANETMKNTANREFNYLTRSRSDATDPGVIGPIAFNFHKMHMENKDNFDSSNDLISMQRRYEGLLDGALSLYSIETTELRTVETFTREELPDNFTGTLIIRKPSD